MIPLLQQAGEKLNSAKVSLKNYFLRKRIQLKIIYKLPFHLLLDKLRVKNQDSLRECQAGF